MMNLESNSLEAKQKEVTIGLPTGKFETIVVNDQCTSRELKVMCELRFGIPCKLQKFGTGESSSKLQDWCSIVRTLELQSEKTITLEVPVWWNKLLCATLNSEPDNVSRRVQLPMQQITKERRCFVALFMACCLGEENLISQLLSLDIKVASNESTEAGRTLLHAAASGGNVKCVELLMKSWKYFSEDLFGALDLNQETPLDIAQRLRRRNMEELLYRYTYHNKGEREERYSVESGIGLNDDSPNGIRVFPDEEGIKTNIESEMQPVSCGDLVIRECDEGWSIVDVTGSKETPPKAANVTPASTDPEKARGRASSPQSSDSSSEGTPSTEMKTLKLQSGSTTQPLLHRRLGQELYRPRNLRIPNFTFSEEEQDTKMSHLPPLEEQNLVSRDKMSSCSRPTSASVNSKRTVSRSLSTPHTPNSRSAPTSPQMAHRLFLGHTSAMKPSFSLSAPGSPEFNARSRRCSEPFGPGSVYSKNLNGGSRRNSHQTDAFSSPQLQQRRKSRSICEATLNDALNDQWLRENGGRLDRPWNAWIMAKRKDSMQTASSLPPTPEELSPPKPANSKRMSFDQWLSEKELEQLRQMYATLLQENKRDEKQNKQFKGKSFEEWMEEKQQAMENEKQKGKESDKVQMDEVQRDRRRRVSQKRYEKWLKQKDQKALDEEEKQLREEKRQLELMRKRWKEEDEKRRKRPAARTQSLPVTHSQRMSSLRFSSLQNAQQKDGANDGSGKW